MASDIVWWGLVVLIWALAIVIDMTLEEYP
jgi:hypothetical protein